MASSSDEAASRSFKGNEHFKSLILVSVNSLAYCHPLTEAFVPVLSNITCNSGRSATHRVRVGVDASMLDHMFQ